MDREFLHKIYVQVCDYTASRGYDIGHSDLREIICAEKPTAQAEPVDTSVDSLVDKAWNDYSYDERYNPEDVFKKILRSILKEHGTAPVSRNEVLDEAIEDIENEFRKDKYDSYPIAYFSGCINATKVIEKLKSKTVDTTDEECNDINCRYCNMEN